MDEDRTMKLNEWNNFSLDLSTLIKQDPGAIYRVLFTFKQEYSLYPCGGMIPQVPQDAGLQRFDNNMSEEDEAVWDQPYSYYYDPTDWEDYNWEEREDPCKRAIIQTVKPIV